MKKQIRFLLFIFSIYFEVNEGEKEKEEESHSESIKINQQDKTKSTAKGMAVASQIIIFYRQTL